MRRKSYSTDLTDKQWNVLEPSFLQRCESRSATELTPDHPSAAMVEAQSVKTTEVAIEVGYDGGKLVKGHKRHIWLIHWGYYCKLSVQLTWPRELSYIIAGEN